MTPVGLAAQGSQSFPGGRFEDGTWRAKAVKHAPVLLLSPNISEGTWVWECFSLEAECVIEFRNYI